jgi:hypothetical protein
MVRRRALQPILDVEPNRVVRHDPVSREGARDNDANDHQSEQSEWFAHDMVNDLAELATLAWKLGSVSHV